MGPFLLLVGFGGMIVAVCHLNTRPPYSIR